MLKRKEEKCLSKGTLGVEPRTSRSAVECSTTELYPHCMKENWNFSVLKQLLRGRIPGDIFFHHGYDIFIGVSNIKYSNSITTLNGYHWMWIMQAIHQQVILAFLVGYKHFEIAVVKWEIRLKYWFSREPFLLVSIPCLFFCFHFCPLSEWSYDWLFFFICDSLLAFRFLHPPTPFDSSDEILALNNDKIIEIRNIPDLHQLVYSDQIEPILKYHLQPWEQWLQRSFSHLEISDGLKTKNNFTIFLISLTNEYFRFRLVPNTISGCKF